MGFKLPWVVTTFKYRNKPTVVGGVRFASKKEAKRYGELLLLQRAGKITDLMLQVRRELYVNCMHVCDYVSDFEYEELGRHVVEDVKGVRTPEYKIKKALMLAVYDIAIREI